MYASSTMIVATASSAADITINARVHAEYQNNSSTLRITNTGSGDDQRYLVVQMVLQMFKQSMLTKIHGLIHQFRLLRSLMLLQAKLPLFIKM